MTNTPLSFEEIHTSFEAYCKAELKMSRVWANRLTRAVRKAIEIAPADPSSVKFKDADRIAIDRYTEEITQAVG